MIKAKNGKVKIEGKTSSILAEYGVLTRSIYRAFSEKIPDEEARKMLEEAFADAFLSDEEVHAKAEKALRSLLQGEGANELSQLFADTLADVLKAGEGADE